MIRYTRNVLFALFALSTFTVLGQPKTILSLRNTEVINGSFYFDLYLCKGINQGPGFLYLGNSDFLLELDPNDFENPSITKEGNATDYCTLRPSDPSVQNNSNLCNTYFNSTMVEIDGQTAIINLNAPGASSSNFTTGIAKIDEAMDHRLGRFKISGAIRDDIHLNWKIIGPLRTKVYGYEEIGYMSSQATLGICPSHMTIDENPMAGSHYQAFDELQTGSGMNAGSNITLSAGQSIELTPGFTAGQNAQFQIIIQGCQ